MADLIVDNAAGLIVTTQPAIILEGPGLDQPGKIIIRLLTLHNPNVSVGGDNFTLDLIVFDQSGDERRIRRFNDSIPIEDTWIFGSLGAILVLKDRQRYEVTLDATPTNPIEYAIDFAFSPI